MTWQEIYELLDVGVRETAWMVGVSALLTAVGGLLVGVLLVLTGAGGLLPLRPLNAVLGLIVNVGRSLPFIILLVAVIPFTRVVVGTTIGTDAAIVPLTIGAIPFFARIVESALREVPPDVVAAATAMGATRTRIVGKVLLREALPALVAGLTITVIALVGYSAMAGVVGGGGLGDLAIRYGYQRFETEVMIATVVALVILVQLVQMLGDLLVRRLSHR
ncbi:D-methionine transport system permease protein [Actinoplanes campanulatus]|uniref:D-methionine transport system permease protein n=1 Tax=Actinoplanes campanulatus TaxID=113559 RepID=A0A7W5FIB7_9ACTN|nr:methionine ABC transporter permease [Actinoplanes campanulatus]MBB3099521.1 D-methionine transport system permease protein [Actinoplanes campanulatus]GGN42448.1 metal ABC transporter permease [Actinoplanes campanulatus]GID39870.1 metal ABC transporter permease [Actinoplanes campanulatus]